MMAAGKDISIDEFNRAVSLSRHAPLEPKGCFYGQYNDQYCVEIEYLGTAGGIGEMQPHFGPSFLVRDLNNGMLIRNLNIRSNSLLVAVDADGNREDEIYVKNGDRAEVYELSWKGLDEVLSLYHEGAVWDRGCSKGDDFKDQPFSIRTVEGGLRIGKNTKDGDFQTRFEVSPTSILEMNRSLWDEFFCDRDCMVQKIKDIIQCAVGESIEHRQLQSALKMVDSAAKKTK